MSVFWGSPKDDRNLGRNVKPLGEKKRWKSLGVISKNPLLVDDENVTQLKDNRRVYLSEMRSKSSNDLEKLVDVKEAAEVIIQTLEEMNTDDDELNHEILMAALNLNDPEAIEKKIQPKIMKRVKSVAFFDLANPDLSKSSKTFRKSIREKYVPRKSFRKEGKDYMKRTILSMVLVVVVLFSCVGMLLLLGNILVGHPREPLGPYILLDAQEGGHFFDSYQFYEGRDSAGSNGFNYYVNRDRAFTSGIAEIKTEDHEEYIYMGSSPTDEGPRESIRLEGSRRFNRGLFILDVRHMPEGCGTWPAFWLTDEPNWPVNGEIDILEGVNYQTEAKTALHTTKTCRMDFVPDHVKTGNWDTAIGVPNGKTGVPDMTLRNATNCFVYDPHQWLNQGCVSVSDDDGSIGVPFNKRGGGVYVLEWDPIYRHIRSWVFSPHSTLPQNIKEALDTVHLPDGLRVNPDPNEWEQLPFGYFAIGDSTNCPASHFKNMRLVFNLAFCGSVSGNRYFMDCPKEFKKYSTCNKYVASNPEALKEAYWKIKGLYVYERQWEESRR